MTSGDEQEPESGEGQESAAAHNGDGRSDIRDEEICRMAAFRVRETANRIATLAHNAQDEHLRRELLQICDALLREERALIERTRPQPPR